MLELWIGRPPVAPVFGKRLWEVTCANGRSQELKALPTVDIMVDEERIRALVDSGCTRTIAARRLVKKFSVNGGWVLAVDGSKVKCGVGQLVMSISGMDMTACCLVLGNLISAFDVIIGMDIIQLLGGVTIGPDRVVSFDGQDGKGCAAAVSKVEQLEIDDADFSAKFYGNK